MAISYTVSKAGTTIQVGYRITGPSLGIYTHTDRHGFLPFDLPGAGVTGGILAADLIVVCVTVVGGGCPIRLKTAVDPNGFGATLDASHDDWASTTTYDEGYLDVNSTGTYTWAIDPTHLSLTGLSYCRFSNDEAGTGAPYNKNVQFASTTAASNKPILRLTLGGGQVIFINVT